MQICRPSKIFIKLFIQHKYEKNTFIQFLTQLISLLGPSMSHSCSYSWTTSTARTPTRTSRIFTDKNCLKHQICLLQKILRLVREPSELAPIRMKLNLPSRSDFELLGNWIFYSLKNFMFWKRCLFNFCGSPSYVLKVAVRAIRSSSLLWWNSTDILLIRYLCCILEF